MRFLKRLDEFRIGDWVTENYYSFHNKVGCITSFGVNRETGYRFARVKTLDGKDDLFSVDSIKPLDPAVADILEGLDDECR